MKKKLLFLFLTMHAEQTSQNLHCYMLANYFQYGNDLDNAEYWYAQIQPDQSQTYIYGGFIPLLASKHMYSQIVSLIPQLDAQYKNNMEIQLIFALALEQTGKTTEARKRLIGLNEQNKAHQELAFKVVQLYLANAEPENAIKVIDNLLNTSAKKMNNFIFYFLKAQIFLQLHKKNDALASLKQCIELYPKFDKSWLLYAALQEQEGKLEEAVRGYTNFLENTTESHKEIEAHLINLTFAQKISQKNNLTLHADYLAQALALLEKREYDKAMKLTQKLFEVPKPSIEACLLKVQILVAQKKLDEALACIQEWVSSDQSAIWLKTIHLLTYLGLPHEKAISVLDQLAKKSVDQDLLLLYKSDLLLKKGDEKNALTILEKLYSQSNDKKQKAKIGYQIAQLKYQQDDWQKTHHLLNEIIGLDNTFAPAYNLLAYITARKKKQYADAQNYIKKALELDPENPHFIDTQAMILYKNNDYKNAFDHLKKAANLCPNDFTIVSRMAKCQYKIGDVNNATKSYKIANTLASNEKDREKIKRRLESFKK